MQRFSAEFFWYDFFSEKVARKYFFRFCFGICNFLKGTPFKLSILKTHFAAHRNEKIHRKFESFKIYLILKNRLWQIVFIFKNVYLDILAFDESQCCVSMYWIESFRGFCCVVGCWCENFWKNWYEKLFILGTCSNFPVFQVV